jgi:uncharacterized protein (DUF58 family)
LAIFPSSRLLLMATGPAVLSLCAIFWPVLGRVVLGLDLAFLSLCLLDALLVRRAPIGLCREHRDVFSVGRPNPVTVRIDYRGPRALDLVLTADLPSNCHSPDLPLSLQLAAGESSKIVYHVVATSRGHGVLGDHFIRRPSRLGLFVVEQRLPASDAVRIYPDLATIRSYELLARKHRQYALVRKSQLRGGESEFARLRDYTTDDDQRLVDWKATARRNKLTAREYQLESDQNIVLVLDAGRLMTAEVDGLSHFDHALNASLLMAHVAARGGDRVGLLCFDERVRLYVPPAGGPRTTRKLTRAVFALEPSLTDSAFGEGLAPLFERLKQRSLIMVFTQLLDDSAARELAEQLRLLSKTHLALVVVLEDSDLERRIHAPPGKDSRLDLFEKGAVAELLTWKAQALQTLRAAGALVIKTPSHDLLPRIVNRYLELKARRAL